MAQKTNSWMMATFVLVGLIVGIGVGIGISQLPFFKKVTGQAPATTAQAGTTPQAGGQIPGINDVVITAVSPTEHVRGAQNPKVTFVEYSDTECPFCKKFHATLQQIIKEFPNDVQWVYRNFPLTDLHSKSQHEAVALECATEIGGNDAFWKYLDRLTEITPTNNGLNPKELDNIAAFVKLDKTQFSTCLASNKYDAKIAAQTEEAVRNGGDGTPFTVVLAPNDKKYLLKGHVEFAALSEAIKKLLAVK